ncbi:hypothetical protein [Roseovarius indicus]|uniref:hypothetical protein n=1 Tax=Roseovarius indicus TaxID=540747 RepID=UPI0007D951C7|nr:hypothetical protein [Roseovarius indicus]OAO05015.1 hypothetical protein A8B76_11305 [Roseovarius indicus]
MSGVQAVFTGDLIDSRDASAEAVERAMANLKITAQSIGKNHEFQPRFTRNRGDGWQMLLPDPTLVMLAYLGLAAALRAADTGLATRIAIGIGPVDFPGTTDLSDAAGPAFVTSGDLLETLDTETAAIGGHGVTDWQRGVLQLTDWVVTGWTAQQAEAVALTLLDPTHDTNAQRAKSLGISRQAFEARLKGSGLAAFTHARHAFQTHDFGAQT